MSESGDPFRRCAGRRDERAAQGLARASKRFSPAAVESPVKERTASPREVPGRVAFLETEPAKSVRERIGSGRRAPRARDVDVSLQRSLRTGVSAIGDASHSRPARTSQAPSIGFLKDLLSVDIPVGVHSRRLAPASAKRLPAPDSFRPRRSSRPRRFPPPTGLRACCVPHPTLRFIGLPRSVTACLRPPPRFPTDAWPSRAFPFREAVPASPRVLAPLSFSGNAGATSRPCSARKSVAATARGRTALLDALLGFPTWSPARTRHPPKRPRTDDDEGRQGPVQDGPIRQRVRESGATGARRPRPHLLRGGGRSERHPRRPAGCQTSASTTHPRARAPQRHPTCLWLTCAAWVSPRGSTMRMG